MAQDIRQGLMEAHEKLTAKFLFQRDFAGAYLTVGDIPEYTDSTERSTVQTTRSENGFKVVNDVQVDVEHKKYDLVLQEGNDLNELLRALGIKNSDVSQTSASAQTATFDAVVEGGTYIVPYFGLTAVSVAIDGGATGVLNTDYTLDAGAGTVYIIPGGIFDGEDIIVTYTRPALTFESFTSANSPMFIGNGRLDEYNQYSTTPLRSRTFQCQLIITAFPTQSGEFGRWTAQVNVISDETILKRQTAY